METLGNFINGVFVKTNETINSFNPSTGKEYLKVPNSDVIAANLAVESAKAAFPKWSATPLSKRSEIMNKVASLLESRLEEFARAESRDQGKPISISTSIDIPRAVYNFRFFANSALYQTERTTYLDDVDAVNIVTREPVGVCVLISPWNLPLYLLTFKIAPAIIHGNTVVCKPSEMTSMTAHMLCEIFNEAGLPPGVVNMVFGLGALVGDALVRHPDVTAVSFTGSTLTGRKIREATTNSCKKLSLELGGKNAAIVFPDVYVDKCVETTLRSCFANQGEICLCTSRVYVHSDIYAEFVEKLVAGARAIRVGDPQDSNTQMGALVSAEHFAKVRGYVQLARKEGATIQCGDGVDTLDLPDQFKQGYFMLPTVITDMRRDSACMLEEIFGPVACVVPFSTEDEAIAEANRVEYGLCAVVWSRDVSRVHRVSRQLHAGTVWANCWMVRDLRVPFGGVKQSGIGREGMAESAEFYTEMKTLCIKI